MEWRKPVAALIRERLGFSMALTLFSFVLIWAVSIPIGVYSATHQYSAGDYLATTLGFLGLAVPNFLLALVILYLVFRFNGTAAVGLFSAEYQLAPWSLAKAWDLAKHLVLPAIIVGASGLAGTIKLIRSNLLDELQKPYVLVARSKGLTERAVLYRYPFRIAINPAISTIGWLLPSLISGEVLVSLVLGLPTIAPLLLKALQSQDMYLAAGILMILSVLTVVGTLVSDVLLAAVDPRIRQEY
jgi:peptide/nickel transport system permease protein